MLTKEQQQTKIMIERALRPLQGRLDKSDKEVRRMKNEINNLKNAVSRIKK